MRPLLPWLVVLAACTADDTSLTAGAPETESESGTTGIVPGSTGVDGQTSTGDEGRDTGVVDTGTTTDGGSASEPDSGSTDSSSSDSGSTGSSDSGSTDSGSTSSASSGSSDSGSSDSSSTGPAETGSSSSDSGSSSSTDSGSTDSGSTDSGSTDSGSTDTGETGGEFGTCLDVVAGTSAACDAIVTLGHTATPNIGVGDSHNFSLGPEGNLVVYDAATLTISYVLSDIEDADLAADRLLTRDATGLTLRNATDGSVVTTFPAGLDAGLSDDGSTLWIAYGTGLEVYDSMGTSVWSDIGDYTGANIVALPDELGVFAPALDVASATVVDLAGGGTQTVGFTGDFERWFADRTRFVTAQGAAHRIYETDGTVLFIDLVPVDYGFGDWYVSGSSLIHLDMPGVAVETLGSGWQAADDMIAFRDCPSGAIITLGDITASVAAFDVGSCDGTSMSFDAADGAWMSAIAPGILDDDLGNQAFTVAPIAIAGSGSGRFAVETPFGTNVYDPIDGCDVAVTASFPQTYDEMSLSRNGNALVGEVTAQNIAVVSIPDGTVQSNFCVTSPCGGPSTQLWGRAWLNDDASLMGLHHWWTGAFTGRIYTVPEQDVLVTSSGFYNGAWELPDMVPFAPCGGYSIETDLPAFIENPIPHESVAYVRLDGAFTGTVLDGVPWGFIDNDLALVGRYVDNDGSCGPAFQSCFDYTEVRAMDGTLVATTSLPEFHRFTVVTPDEIFVDNPPRIYDVYSGALLWQDAEADVAQPVGTDHVVTLDDGVLSITMWRP